MISSKVFFKRLIDLPTILVGMIIVKLPLFYSYKLHLLSTWQNAEKRNILDRILFNRFFGVWIKLEYLKERDPDKREKLKSYAMGGESGKNWAESYQKQFSDSGFEGDIDLDSKLGDMTFGEAVPIFNSIDKILQKSTGSKLVIQIGSSSGKEIAYFAKRYPQHSFIGTDIYEEVLNYSQQYHKNNNLKFFKSSAKDLQNVLHNNSEDIHKEIIIFSNASLQYVQPEHLEDFFQSIMNSQHISIVLLEPVNHIFSKPDELEGSIYRANFAYTHDYKWYAEKSGIKTIDSKIFYPYKDSLNHKNTSHYFYFGTNKAN
ncbi:MAG: class I SAM-dependent methyltransferase [Gammaproteobacteria bacterium]|nr:class I SAM-dependent methyltransferase [Gammaproteobacteria bacterium]